MIGVSLSLSLIDITHTHTTDGGSHFSFGPFQGDSKIANALNDISCEFQLPVFPTASPYVVSVGGEMWKNGDSHKPITWTVRVSLFFKSLRRHTTVSFTNTRIQNRDSVEVVVVDSRGHFPCHPIRKMLFKITSMRSPHLYLPRAPSMHPVGHTRISQQSVWTVRVSLVRSWLEYSHS